MLKYLVNVVGEFENFTYIWYSLGAIYLIYAFLIRRKNKAIGNSVCSLFGILIVIGRLKIDPYTRRFILVVVECFIIILAHTILMKLKKGKLTNVEDSEKIESH